MLCGADNILRIIPHIHFLMWGIFYIVLLVPQNTFMDLKNVMVKKKVVFVTQRFNLCKSIVEGALFDQYYTKICI
jgi:hypothetical protein